MRRIILFTNIKGGVGKTSCCALFAQYLCENGYSVKVLDADIQASLSRHRRGNWLPTRMRLSHGK